MTRSWWIAYAAISLAMPIAAGAISGVGPIEAIKRMLAMAIGAGMKMAATVGG